MGRGLLLGLESSGCTSAFIVLLYPVVAASLPFRWANVGCRLFLLRFDFSARRSRF
jgi:hypothetical protein